MSNELVTFMKDLFLTLISHAALKAIIAVIGGALLYLIGVNNLDAVAVVGCLCLLDTIMAMYVLHKKKLSPSSRRLPKKIYDLTIYIIIIMTMNLLTLINPHLALAVDTAILYCAATEALSILEHAAELGFKIPISILQDIKKEEA